MQHLTYLNSLKTATLCGIYKDNIKQKDNLSPSGLLLLILSELYSSAAAAKISFKVKKH